MANINITAPEMLLADFIQLLIMEEIFITLKQHLKRWTSRDGIADTKLYKVRSERPLQLKSFLRMF